jgi:hypothetical protein
MLPVPTTQDFSKRSRSNFFQNLVPVRQVGSQLHYQMPVFIGGRRRLPLSGFPTFLAIKRTFATMSMARTVVSLTVVVVLLTMSTVLITIVMRTVVVVMMLVVTPIIVILV